jgi:hypothetical protein
LTALVSVRRRAKQAASPFLGVEQEGSRATFFLAEEAGEAEETDGAAAWAGICMPRAVIAAALRTVRQAAALRRKAEPVLAEVRKTLLPSLPCKGRLVRGYRSTENAGIHTRRNQLAYFKAQMTINSVLHVHVTRLFLRKMGHGRIPRSWVGNKTPCQQGPPLKKRVGPFLHGNNSQSAADNQGLGIGVHTLRRPQELSGRNMWPKRRSPRR